MKMNVFFSVEHRARPLDSNRGAYKGEVIRFSSIVSYSGGRRDSLLEGGGGGGGGGLFCSYSIDPNNTVEKARTKKRYAAQLVMYY